MPEGPNILIVDDKAENLFTLETILKGMNIEIFKALSGNEALKLTLENEFAIAIVDVQMPGMNGYELVKLMRQQENTRYLPIIYQSAVYSEDHYLQEGLDTGAIDFITKPVNPQILAAKVNTFLEMYKQKCYLESYTNQLTDIIEQRKIAETNLRKKEENIRNILNSISSGIIIIDCQTNLVADLNSAAERITGLHKSDIVNQPAYYFGNPDELIMANTDEVIQIENQINRTDGKIIPVILNINRTSIDDKDYIVCSFIDISKQKHSEEKVKLQSMALEAAANAVAIIDKHETITWTNTAFSTITGYSPSEVIGKTFRTFCSECNVSSFENIWKTVSEGNAWRGEIANTRKNGSLYHEEMTITPLTDGNGGILNFVAIKQDITDRKKIDLEIQHSREELERRVRERTRELTQLHTENTQLLEAIPSILIALDSDNRIINWNAAAESTFGIISSNAIGIPLEECKASWNIKTLLKEIDVCRNNDKPTRIDRMKYIRPEGSDGILGMTVNPVMLDSDNRSTEILLLGTDITDRIQLETELSQAHKLESIGQLASGIAHEINTPIQYVGDNTHFLETSFKKILEVCKKHNELLNAVKTESVLSELINDIDATIKNNNIEYIINEIPDAIKETMGGIDRVTKIVKAMKEFAHPGSKDKCPVDINHAINNTITIAKNEWKYVSDLKADLSPDIKLTPCVEDQFNQVILNMIVNAAHSISDVLGESSDTKGLISITTKPIDNFTEIIISDTGKGIPEDILDNIFDPFFTTKEVGRGSGQGLAIAHDIIVCKHKGTISCKSIIGEGTTFTIRLPVKTFTDEEKLKLSNPLFNT